MIYAILSGNFWQKNEDFINLGRGEESHHLMKLFSQIIPFLIMMASLSKIQTFCELNRSNILPRDI